MAVLFLELEDEITSAVGRLRAASDPSVALVLPSGSRIASSRINFRLLAREAEAHGTQLAIVSPEATARALASAAGLPTFGTVNRYENAMAGGTVAAGEGGASPGGVDRDATLPAYAPGAGVGPAGGETPGGGLVPGGRYGPETGFEPAGAAEVAGGLAGGLAAAGAAGSRRLPVAHAPRRLVLPRIGRGSLVAVLVVLAFLAAGTIAGAYFLLPEARITITPRVEAFAPLVFDVTADPGVTTSDAATGIVPASWLDTTVNAQDTFDATGLKIAETKATGTVTFSNRDIGGPVSIPAGATVKTRSGVAFVTNNAVTVPQAAVQQDPNGNLILVPGTASVGVTAAKAGTAGNVAAGTITVVPKGDNPNLLKVTNPRATSGGTHTETKLVRQSDYDAAVAALTKQLQQSFADWLASGPEGTALRLDDSAVLDDPTFDTAAADVVGKEVDRFDLLGHADGRVLTVDPALLDAAGIARFKASSVPAGDLLIDPSVAVQHRQVDSSDPAKPVFELTVNGQGYRQLDPAALKKLLLGKPVGEARALLRTYGDPVVTLNPDWFGTIPQLDWRVSLQVLPPPGAA